MDQMNSLRDYRNTRSAPCSGQHFRNSKSKVKSGGGIQRSFNYDKHINKQTNKHIHDYVHTLYNVYTHI